MQLATPSLCLLDLLTAGEWGGHLPGADLHHVWDWPGASFRLGHGLQNKFWKSIFSIYFTSLASLSSSGTSVFSGKPCVCVCVCVFCLYYVWVCVCAWVFVCLFMCFCVCAKFVSCVYECLCVVICFEWFFCVYWWVCVCLCTLVCMCWIMSWIMRLRMCSLKIFGWEVRLSFDRTNL